MGTWECPTNTSTHARIVRPRGLPESSQAVSQSSCFLEQAASCVYLSVESSRISRPFFGPTQPRPFGVSSYPCTPPFPACDRNLLEGGKKLSCKTHPVCEQWYLHRFRKTFATKMHYAGMPLRDLQKMLGHKSLSTTTLLGRVRLESSAHAGTG